MIEKYRNIVGWGSMVFGVLGFTSFLAVAEPSLFGLCDYVDYRCYEMYQDIYSFNFFFFSLSFAIFLVSLFWFVFYDKNRKRLAIFSVIFVPTTIGIILTSGPGNWVFPGTGEIIGWPALGVYFLYLLTLAFKDLLANVKWIKKFATWKLLFIMIILAGAFFFYIVGQI